MRRLLVAVSAAAIAVAAPTSSPAGRAASPPDRQQVLDTMKRATTFMVEKVSTRGGYVWTYLPDLSRRWGEMEARDTMIWVQPPGTPAMGHLFLDAYHATGDEYYYRAAAAAADALIQGQLPCGGWNYVIDFAGERSLREWYDTIGRNGWRLEEFQHYWPNATFDDGGTAQSATLLLRLFLEKREARFKRALDRTIRFVLESQSPVGAWPQRYPPANEFTHHGKPDYTSYLTFNDEVTAGSVEFLLLCYQALGDARLREPIARGMHAFLVTQQPAPQGGWALQYTPDLKPAGARTYEPAALATHTTAQNVEHLLRFYRLTGDRRFLARVPDALDWLDSVKVPADMAQFAGTRTHPTFVEIGTNKPLYVHRRGSNVVNGEYFVNDDPRNTLGHYQAFRQIDTARLRMRYQETKAVPPADVVKGSPLAPGAKPGGLPRYFLVREAGAASGAGWRLEETVAGLVRSLNAAGYWPTELGTTSHPYRGDGAKRVAPGDFSRTQVGDESDTSPYRVEHLVGISTAAYIRNMSELIRGVGK